MTFGIVASSGPLVTAGYATAVLADSPYAYYRLKDASGNPADSSGNSRDATAVSGSPTYNTSGGPVAGGGYMAFDGTDDYVSLGNLDSWLNVSGDTYAIEFWIRSSSSTGSAVMGVFNDGGTVGLDVRFNYDDNETVDPGEVEVFTRETAGNSLVGDTSGQALNDGNWHHVVIVFKGAAADYDFLVDGAVVTSANSLSGSSPIDSFADLAYDLVLGARNVRGTVGRHIAADIAEVAFYTGTLSTASFQAHYNAA